MLFFNDTATTEIYTLSLHDAFRSSGCGDLIANIIAVKDWQLGHQKTGEYYGTYSAELAMMSAMMVLDNSRKYAKKGLDARVIVEALISAGVASCIAGSSRPCSGAEHLFSHALDKIAPGKGLHGEKCGIGSIMIAKLQGQDWKKIVKTLKRSESTRLNSSHTVSSYAVFCLKKKIPNSSHIKLAYDFFFLH